MRVIRKAVAAVIFFLSIGLFAARDKTPAELQPAGAKEMKSLVRKDLLQLKLQEAAPPKRNIFAPRPAAGRPGDTGQRIGPVPPLNVGADNPEGEEQAVEAPPIMSVNLRYIGFISSPHRLVALIIFEGRAIAVSEGDVVGEGIRIGRVTREQVEVLLPDSSTRTFSLEGE